MDRSFYEARVNVPKLSGFDKSFQNLFTAPVGTLVPALFDEIMAGSIIDLDMAVSASLPPLASDTFMRCSLKVEAFLVPMRLCYGGFEHFFVGDDYEVATVNGVVSYDITKLPIFGLWGTYSEQADEDERYDSYRGYFGAGSLADYLGFKADLFNWSASSSAAIWFNALPWVAYHKIWSDWYRASLIQRDCFMPYAGLGNESYFFATLPFSGLRDDSDYSFNIGSLDPSYNGADILADGVSLFSLRQRNFGFDYFTTATPSPQNGDAQRVTLNANNLSSGFTINQLRSANAIQQFLERNNLAGDRYVDRLYAQYGIRPSDGIAQRTLCIGSGEFEVYNKGIYENAGNGVSQNPFVGQVGNRVGSASASGRIRLCKGLKVSEPSYLFVITSLVPRVTYSMGVNKALLRYTRDNSIGEMANPILQSIGPEPIYAYELSDPTGLTSQWDKVFGFTDRYGSFKAKFDELHGLLREGESLSSFAAQRYLDATSDPQIDSEFLEIPRNYLDNVTAVAGDLSKYGVWVDSYFKYHVAMPLARYSLPTLQDPAYEHGRSITVTRGGHRF